MGGESGARQFTRIIHGGLAPDPSTGAVLTPIFQSTTFAQEAVGKHKGYTYSRSGNPTVAALERNLGEIEGWLPAACFATGMAAIHVLFLATLKAGDHVVVLGRRLRRHRAPAAPGARRLRRRASFVDTSDLASSPPRSRPKTRLVLVESPANPDAQAHRPRRPSPA